MTPDEQRAMRGLTTARVRRNYWLCQSQLEMIHDQDAPARLAEAAGELLAWQANYLDELVRRGERV